MRALLKVTVFLALILGATYGYLFWNNNRPAPYPDRTELNRALEKSVDWLENNRTAVLKDTNPMLWRMLQQASELSGDARLVSLYGEYEELYLKRSPNSYWRPLFYPGSWVPVRFEDIASLPYYNWHFIYAITCDTELAQVPKISAQNDPAFCDAHPLRPACVTHQLMGIRLLQRSECGDPDQLEQTVAQLQRRIHQQLTWDPRVVDVYLQRVLMLTESGDRESVKPIWLQRLIDAQQEDGGWSPFEPLIPIGSGRHLGFSSRGFSLGKPRSTLHATAQGVLLLTILTSDSNTL